MRTLLMAATLAMMPAAASADPLPRIPCEVDRVLDGDTFDAHNCTPWPGLITHARVRVLGIDTPERGWRADCEDEALLADLATEAARELLGERVMLVVEGRDSFGRILAHVLLEDGRDYGTEMIARGLAMPYAERERGWCKKDRRVRFFLLHPASEGLYK